MCKRSFSKNFVFLTLLPLALIACGNEAPPPPVTDTTLVATATTVVSVTATTRPTATPAIFETKEWASVKSIGAEVKTEPRANSSTIEKLAGFTLLALQNRFRDDTWVERAGGGWIDRNQVVIYANELEARRNAPKITAAPITTIPITTIPTFNSNPLPTSKAAAPAVQANNDLTAVRPEREIVKTFTDAQGRSIKLTYGRGNGRGGDYGWSHILGKHVNGIWYDGGTITTFPQAVGAKTPEAVVDLIGQSLQDKNPDNQDGGRRTYSYPVPGTNKDVFTVVGNDGTIITSYPVPHGSKDANG